MKNNEYKYTILNNICHYYILKMLKLFFKVYEINILLNYIHFEMISFAHITYVILKYQTF